MAATTRCRGGVTLTTAMVSMLLVRLAGEPLPLFPVREVWSAPLTALLAASPLYDGTHGYFPLEGEGVAAYDLVQGERLWTAPLHTRSRPTAGEDLVFLILSDALVAVRAVDGSQVWRMPFSAPLAAPLVWDNGWLIAATESGAVMAFRASDGELVWQREIASKASASPTLAADRVYISVEDGRLMALQVVTGEPIWERRFSGAPHEVLAVGTRLYTGSTDNFFYCLNAEDGQILWRWRTGADVIGLPAADEQRVYFVSLDNVLRALDLSNGAERWHRALPIRPSTGPVQAGDALLVSGIGPTVFGFRRLNGIPAGDIAEKTGELTAPPHVMNGLIAPTVIVARYDVVRGPEIRAFTRRIDPAVEPLLPLPNPTPVGLPSQVVPALPVPNANPMGTQSSVAGPPGDNAGTSSR